MDGLFFLTLINGKAEGHNKIFQGKHPNVREVLEFPQEFSFMK
jgi:hypothetical protein